MSKFDNFIDKIAIREILSFFLIILLVLTLITMVFDVHIESNTFKLIVYGIVLIFFFKKFKDFSNYSENKDNSNNSNNNAINSNNSNNLFKSLFQDFSNIFTSIKLYQILFVVIANLLFIMALFFVLIFLTNYSFFSFLDFINGFNLFGVAQTNYLLIIIEFISTVILASIVEELMFRGVILKNLASMTNINLAILISSILFGFCHNIGGILSAVLFGICMSILYIKSNNIAIPIFAHFLNNLISFLLLYSGIGYFLWSNINIMCVILILGLISNFILFRGIIKEWPRNWVF